MKLFFDWNDVEGCESKEKFFSGILRLPDLEMVTLRRCRLSVSTLTLMVDGLLEVEGTSKLKCLDLFQNDIDIAGKR